MRNKFILMATISLGLIFSSHIPALSIMTGKIIVLDGVRSHSEGADGFDVIVTETPTLTGQLRMRGEEMGSPMNAQLGMSYTVINNDSGQTTNSIVDLTFEGTVTNFVNHGAPLGKEYWIDGRLNGSQSGDVGGTIDVEARFYITDGEFSPVGPLATLYVDLPPFLTWRPETRHIISTYIDVREVHPATKKMDLKEMGR